MSFAEDSSLLKDRDNSQREDGDMLHKIDEEGSGDEGENEKILLLGNLGDHLADKGQSASNKNLKLNEQEEEEVVNSNR